MAIKGKSKPKGGARSVTRGPRPAYVAVHTPLLQRRWFWLTVLGVVILGSVVGISYGLARQRETDREEALATRLREAVIEYQGQVEPVLSTIGTPVAPSGIDTFPDLSAALNAFIDGEGEPADLETVAVVTSESAATAAEDLEAVEPASIMGGKGFEEIDVLYVINSQLRMAQALRLYEHAALLAEDAATTEGDAGVELATRAKEIVQLAKRIFADGYQDYVEAQFRAQVFQPVSPVGTTP